MDEQPPAWVRIRRKIVSAAIEAFLRAVSNLGKLHSYSLRLRKGVDVARNIAYADAPGRDYKLDIYRAPGSNDADGPLPAFMYIHGGGFRILSKDTHWMFGHAYARRGFVVFSINYRLGRTFPAALEDVARAYAWVVENAERYGADIDRLVIGGESAGANLALALTIMSCWERPEVYAKPVFELGVRPKVVLPACGMLEVGRAERYLDNERIPVWMRDRIHAVCRGYLPEEPGDIDQWSLANPLRFLESAPPPAHPLPPMFAPCGDNDPVLDDTVRLGRALERLGVDAQAPIYPGGMHAFHAMVWSPLALRCWADQDRFLADRGYPRALEGAKI